MDMKRFFLYAIVIAALALAGCGGNGNGPATVDPTDPVDPVDPPSEYLSISALNLPMGYDSVPLTGDNPLVIEPGESSDEHGDVIFSCPAGGPACTVTVEEHGDHVDVKSTGGIATVARSQASMDRQMAAEMMEEEQRMAAIAAATKAAGTKRMAIAAEAAQAADADAGLGGSANLGADNTTGTDDDPYSLTITRDRTSTEVKIADSGLAGDDDPKFMQAADLGYGTTMHVRTKAADEDGNVEEEVVVVTTNIEAPRGRPFAMFQNIAADGTTTTPQALNADADGTAQTPGTDDAVAFDPGAALARTTTGDVPVLNNIASPSFASPVAGSPSVTHNFEQDTDDQRTGNQYAMVVANL